MYESRLGLLESQEEGLTSIKLQRIKLGINRLGCLRLEHLYLPVAIEEKMSFCRIKLSNFKHFDVL